TPCATRQLVSEFSISHDLRLVLRPLSRLNGRALVAALLGDHLCIIINHRPVIPAAAEQPRRLFPPKNPDPPPIRKPESPHPPGPLLATPGRDATVPNRSHEALIRGFGDAQFIPGGRHATAILPLAWCCGRACHGPGGDYAAGYGPGDHQGRHPA